MKGKKTKKEFQFATDEVESIENLQLPCDSVAPRIADEIEQQEEKRVQSIICINQPSIYDSSFSFISSLSLIHIFPLFLLSWSINENETITKRRSDIVG